jgi:aryl-phospho-beta-D-glucosidase BglC (GH1 family)
MARGDVLRVRGDRIVGADGQPVILRGYNVGGWMNMENFLTGYPGTESQHRRALRDALGPDRYELFFERFMDAFFADADVAYLASLGLNSIRLPFSYRHFEDDDQPFQLKEAGFALLDRAVASCARHGLYVVLDLHALPGGQNRHWHSDNPTHHPAFWDHRHFADRVVHLWEALADRYKGNATVAGYNIMNEPGDIDGDKIKPFYDRAEAAVRAVDPDHILFLDGNRYGTQFTAFEDAPLYDNTVYAVHDYHLPGFGYGGPYPGLTRGVYVDRAEVERTFLARTEFMRSAGTPIWVGEFGPVFTGEPDRDEQRYQLLADQLALYGEHGAGWALWAYKDMGGEGVVSAAAGSPWSRRVRPVTEKKDRLGVDGWGSTDAGVRHITRPVEETFAKEYPNFDPFPFGAVDWITVLVRSILLAEPMLGDFRACFTDVGDDETVIALAESFALENCVKRDRLAALLSAAARA